MFVKEEIVGFFLSLQFKEPTWISTIYGPMELKYLQVLANQMINLQENKWLSSVSLISPTRPQISKF